MLPFTLYAFYSVFFYIQKAEEKFNAYFSAYHPEIPLLQSRMTINPDPLLLKKYVNELTFLHLLIYFGMSFYLILRTYKRENLFFFSGTNKPLSWLRNFTLLLLILILIKTFTMISYIKDLGDYINASYFAVLIYSVSFSVIKQSVFFSEGPFFRIRKYEKSSLTEEMKKKTLKKLNGVMEEQKPYLDYSISLPRLAKSLGISPNHLSQILNESLKKNFFEYIADYRIKEAQKILSDPTNLNVMIEEIAERVGYNSKSAFNTAFKKHNGITPSKFRALQTGSAKKV
jgi:AraC-like DNA-binding protein